MASLTTSGNEITDLARANALAWLATQQGGSVDEFQSDSSFGIWEAGTNLHRHGQCDSLTDWSVAGVTSSRTLDATTAAPFSPQSVKIVTTGANIGGGIGQSATGQAKATGTVGVGSIYLKGVAGLTYDVSVEWVNTDASTTAGSATTWMATGGWDLVVPASVSVAAGKTGDMLRVRCQTHAVRASESFWLAHPMLQSGMSFVTPYVATAGGTATRATPRVQAPASLLDTTQGWIAFRLRMGISSASVATKTSGEARLFRWGDGAHGISAYWTSTNLILVRDSASGINGSKAFTFAAGDLVTVVVAWTATQLLMSINGSAFSTVANTPTVFGAMGQIDIGTFGTGRELDGDLLWTMCGKGTLTNADATTLSAQGSTDPGLGLLGATAQTTAVVPFNTSLYNSYVDAPVTNDLAGSAVESGAGTVYIFGGYEMDVVGSLAGAGTTLVDTGLGLDTATGDLTGAGVVYDLGGFPFFGDSGFAGSPSDILQGGGELHGESFCTGSGEILRSPPAASTGRIAGATTGDIKEAIG